MNRHLKEQSPPLPPPSVRAPSAPATRRRSWRSWLFVLGLVFGVYVFLGDFILQPEYQWSTVSGRITGKTVAAATVAATAAKASEAQAVATVQEQAKVEPHVEIAARLASIEVAKNYQLAKIEVAKQGQINALEVAKGVAAQEAIAYRACMDRAQRAGEAAFSMPSTFGAQQVARDMAFARASESCEPLQPLETRAQDGAAQATEWATETTPRKNP